MCGIAAGIAAPALADELSFEDRVRAFILDNPEIILEALTILSEREAQAAVIARLQAFPNLFSDKPALGEGDPDAPRRVIEFFDYKCVPCKTIHPALVSHVETAPDLRVEMRHLPILTPGSERAARFALAVRTLHGDALYRAAHDMLWEMRGPLNNAGFARIAAELGLAFDPLAAAMESDDITARITYNRDAAIALEILGTPAFVTPTNVTFGITDMDVLSEAWLNQ